MQLMRVLEESRALGFLGPGALGSHVRHSLGFALAVSVARPSSPAPGPLGFLDLGSGGGVPGLVLALLEWRVRGVLLESNRRRSEFLVGAVERLGLSDRVSVVNERAEVAGHDLVLRGGFDVVVVRGFGPPAVTAECGGPFVASDGLLVVSEPPTDEVTGLGDRWRAQVVTDIGFGTVRGVHAGTAGFAVLTRTASVPPSIPRRTGVPRKRPLF